MTALVSLENISVRFPAGGGWLRGPRREVQAAMNVSLAIQEGEAVALVGESGSGKTTLGNVVASLQAPSSGTLRFRGNTMFRATQQDVRRCAQSLPA